MFYRQKIECFFSKNKKMHKIDHILQKIEHFELINYLFFGVFICFDGWNGSVGNGIKYKVLDEFINAELVSIFVKLPF